MTTSIGVRQVSAAALRGDLLDGDEIAVIDIREGDAYAGGHISVAVPVPDSELELRIGALVPRRATRIVLTDSGGDGAGEGAAVSAANRLLALGYQDVRVLSGGVPGWAAQGFELITGLNSLSKALGEFVERHYHTPRITVEELKAKIDAGDDIVVLDTRPLPEYTHISIPTGEAAPGAELLFRAFDRIPTPQSQVVVNCAGRTRAIIGAQALINAGVTNPVVALENGTSAWQFAGFEPARGQTTTVERPTGAGLARAVEAAGRIRRRFGVRTIGAEELARFRAESDGRTVYVYDVRTPEDFAAGHLPGARPAPGGQLVQATDQYVGVRQARVVLVDEENGVRATVTASWLIQLGLDDVFVYPAAPDELTEPLSPEPAADSPNLIGPADLAARTDVTVIDLQGALPYYAERRFLPGSVHARRSTLLRSPDLLTGPTVLTSPDGALARLAADELAALGKPVLALAGGVDAWVAAGLPSETGSDQPSLVESDALRPAPTLDQSRATFAQYVAWGDQITEQLRRDGIVRFREFDDSGPR